MIEQNGSDPMFGKEKDENEQDIIELTDKTVPESTTDDDEILEMTSEVKAAAGEADGEEILELTSAVEESIGDADDEDILELISEVEETIGEPDEEEVLELTSEIEETAEEIDSEEILEPASAVEEIAGEENDEDILDLLSEVEEAAEETDSEELLELTSEVGETTGEADDKDILDLLSEAEETAEETDSEEILELTSEVDEITGDEFVEQTESELHDASWERDEMIDEKEPEEISAQSDEEEPETISEISEDEEDLIDLLSDEPETAEEPQHEAVTEEEIPKTTPAEVPEFQEPSDVDSQTDLPEKDVELASVMGIELDPVRDLSLELNADIGDIEVDAEGLEANESGKMPTFIIPKKQLEAAIERAIETKLSEKIDRLLTEAVEKAVTTEIGRLKRLLTDDLPDN